MVEAQAQTTWRPEPAAAPPLDYPVQFLAPYPARLSRWKTALRPALAIPHVVILLALLSFAQLLSVVVWLSIVFSGQCDPAIWRLSYYCMRALARLTAYVTLLRDEYPPFGDGAYPAQLLIPFPEGPRRRVGVFFRPVLVYPQFAVLYVLFIPLSASVVIAWFAILITGRYPEGIWRLVVGLVRWQLRVYAYALLLRDEYPPFSLGLHEPATLTAQAAVAAEPPDASSAYADEAAAESVPLPAPGGWPELPRATGPTEEPPTAVEAEPPRFTPLPAWRGWADAAPAASAAPTLPGWPGETDAGEEPAAAEDR